MGHIVHLRNQFKSMSTFEQSYDYIYYKIGPVVQEEILKFRERTFAILLLSPNVKRWGLSNWTNLNTVYRGMLFAKFGWNWPSGSVEEDFYKLLIYFYYFPIISPLGRAWSFIWTNLNPFYPGILSAKFGWNWPSGSGEKQTCLPLQSTVSS